MSGYKFNPSTVIFLLIVMLVSIFRIVAPHAENFREIANFSAIGALALFGGAYFNTNAKAFGLPLLAILLSDVFIAQTSGYGFFYSGWYWTYIAFILMVFAGKQLLKQINVQNLLLSTIVVTLIHWIVADIGVMYMPGLYPPTLAGYWTCLVNAIPFEKSFLYGTVVYGSIMFGIMALYPGWSFKKTVSV